MRGFLAALFFACLSLLLILVFFSWLIFSPSGTRWALNQFQNMSHDSVIIGDSEGSLYGSLRLKSVEVVSHKAHIRIGQLEVDSRISSIFPLKIEIHHLQLAQFKIQVLSAASDQGEAAVPFALPPIPWYLRLLDIDLQQADIREVEYVQGDNLLQRIDRLQSEVSWQFGQLQLQQVQFVTPALKGHGSLRINFDQPEFILKSRTESLAAGDLWKLLELDADLQPVEDSQAARGSLKITVTDEQDRQLQARADIEIAEQILHFHQFQLQRPGQPGMVTATGTLRVSQPELEVDSLLQLEQVNLERETGQPLQLSGSIQIKGGLDTYHGQFALRNQASELADISLAGQFKGNRQQLELSELKGEWLAGLLSGQALVARDDNGWRLTADLVGNQLDPQLLEPQLAGVLNLKVSARLKQEKAQPLQGYAHLTLLESSLQGQPISGEASLRLDNEALVVDKLQIRGAEMLLQANGNPAERLTFSWQVGRLDQLLSDLHGRFSGQGWLQWQQPLLAVEFTSEGAGLNFHQWQLDQLKLAGGTTEVGNNSWHLQLNGQGLKLSDSGPKIDKFKLQLKGTFPAHQLALNLNRQQDNLSVILQGGWAQQQWRGNLTEFKAETTTLGDWRLVQATTLFLSREKVYIDRLTLHNADESELSLSGHYDVVQPTTGELHWRNLDLALFKPWLDDWQVTGRSSGQLSLDYGADTSIHGEASIEGEVQRQQLHFKLTQGRLLWNWDQGGLQSSLQLGLFDGAQLEGTLRSSQPADFNPLHQLEFNLNGQAFPLLLLHPWLPPALNLSGQFALKSSGHWHSGASMNISGQAKVMNGRFSWQEEEGLIGADIDSAECNWLWENDLKGNFNLDLGKHGNIETVFTLPLKASLPLVFNQEDPIQGDLQARLQELGLLSVMFPGQVQDSHGHLKLNLQLSGTFGNPEFAGHFHLFGGQAFIPFAGIQLKEIVLSGELKKELIRLDEFLTSSGKGQLKGHGQIALENWVPGLFRLELSGKDFQLINQPELQVAVDPQVELKGRRGHYSVRGQLALPDVLISGQEQTSLARNSADLIVVDRKISTAAQQKWKHDIDIELLLGDRVLVNTAGLNARLEGSLQLQSTTTQGLMAKGEVHVAKGKYASYGLNLDIDRGYFYFTGGPLSQPTLDIRALRSVGEVKAGVKVTGTPQLPMIQLYSEPIMAETDILSYLVLGRPVGSERSETGLLMTAAGALLSQGESVVLQEKLKNRLGLDVLDFSAGSGNINDSTITTGKYLTPDLYVSLGYSLFRNTNEVKIRYSLTPTWEIESSIGSESGVDLYHLFEIE